MTARSLTVLDPGALTTVQDRGRPGLAHLGVPRSGALDAPAAALANRLVGNPATAAVLESTAGGPVLRVGRATTVAVTGAWAPVRVDGRPRAFAEPLSLRPGEVLEVGPPVWGVRSYLAVGGGLAVDAVLGSRSHDTLSGLGPPPLRAGDVLPLAPPAGPPAPLDTPPVRRPPDPVVLGCTPGPRLDWLTDAAAETLVRATYTVGAESNRVGVRLSGPALSRRPGRAELPSEGVPLGGVQVPPSGQPLVFLHDHPTTGGYPVVAVVHAEDLPWCAQLRPGDRVRFRPATRPVGERPG